MTLRRILSIAALALALAGIGFMAWRTRNFIELDEDELAGGVEIPVEQEA